MEIRTIYAAHTMPIDEAIKFLEEKKQGKEEKKIVKGTKEIPLLIIKGC